MTQIIKANGLTKSYGGVRALDAASFEVETGRIVGLIGPNGAGKTTALKAILGLTHFEGELAVLGRNPYTERDALMREVCFIADVAVMPEWLQVSQALDFVAARAAALRPLRAPKVSCRKPTSSRKAACASSPRAWSRSCIWRSFSRSMRAAGAR